MDVTNPNSSGVLIRQTERQERIPGTAQEALSQHWPEYLMEAAELGIFMISACAFTVLLFHPSSPISNSIHTDLLRRMLMGVAMGSTAIAIIFSPLGKRSGGHFNPAVTLVYFTLRKIKPWDAAFYTLFQFGGGIAGVIVASLVLGNSLQHANVKYAVTVPGQFGSSPAFFAELTITFILMSVILNLSNSKRLGRWTGVFAGILVAIYITIESPISGMSMNPARTLGSATSAQIWTGLWIYFVAPPAGMLLAAGGFKHFASRKSVVCAKLHHHNNERCIFNCNFEG